MSTRPKPPNDQSHGVSPAPIAPGGDTPDTIKVQTAGSGMPIQVAALALSGHQAKLARGLFWAVLAILLILIVILSVIFTGTWSMGSVRGAVIPVICGGALLGAGVCAKTAINRLFPGL